MAPAGVASQSHRNLVVMHRAILIVVGLLVGPCAAFAQPDDELPAPLDAFGGARRAERWSHAIERPRAWMLYGRLGVLSFQNALEPRDKDALRFSLRSSEPGPRGKKVYIGIYREF